MAWLARSIANSLKLDEDDEDVEKKPQSGDESVPNQSVSESQSPRGVKEDISELTKTLRSQFWGVASFLSQPPNLQESNQSPDREGEEEDEDLIAGIRNDFAEIGGRFRTGISKLSENLPVSDFTKMASNFLQLGSEGVDPKDVIGVTEELVAFVRDLAMRPETWLDLPLPDEDDDDDDTFNGFEMTDDQHDHAVAVERLVPSLASLRIELCPEYMTENCFWMIYFVLVHPNLSQHDSLHLSTPQVLEARAMLSHELGKINRAPVEGESSQSNAAVVEPLAVPYNPSQESLVAKTVNRQEYETDKHPVESKEEIQVVDKSVIEERNSSTDSSSSSRFVNVQAEDVEEEDADDWLNDEESSDAVSGMEGGVTTKHPLGEEDEEEDVSFSDLEEDDDEERDVPVSSKRSTNSSSPDWVQL
ncbi:hypothetical protein Bca4012_036168 [Brassica carinata]